MPARVLSEGWLAAYMRYTEDQEAPELYHFWTALSVIAGAVRRNMWIDRVDYTIFPNLYVFLVGPSAIGKSTALMTGAKLLYKVEGVKFLHGRISNEALFDVLNRAVDTPDGIQKDGTLFMFADEVKSLLGERDYARELLTTLTDLYSGEDGVPFQHRTISRGEASPSLTNYLINFLAGTTQSWLGEVIRPSMFDGGAMGRVIFVTQNRGRGISDNDPEDRRDRIEALREQLIHDLGVIAGMKGGFRIRKDARDFWTCWRKSINRTCDPRLVGYMGRKHDTVLKLAMLFSVSANDSMTIEIPHIQGAIATLDSVEPLMLEAFSHIGSNESIIGGKMLAILDRLGGKAPHYLLLRQLGHLVKDSRAFQSVLQTLELQGKITLVRTGSQIWVCAVREEALRPAAPVEEQNLPFGTTVETETR